MEKPTPSPANTRGILYVRIPAYNNLSADQQAAIVTDGYPVLVSEHLPQHEDFADFLIERSLDAWTRSAG